MFFISSITKYSIITDAIAITKNLKSFTICLYLFAVSAHIVSSLIASLNIFDIEILLASDIISFGISALTYTYFLAE